MKFSKACRCLWAASSWSQYLCRSDIVHLHPRIGAKKENDRLIEPAVVRLSDQRRPVQLSASQESAGNGQNRQVRPVGNASFANLQYQAQALNNQVPFSRQDIGQIRIAAALGRRRVFRIGSPDGRTASHRNARRRQKTLNSS